jgi:hypothetical protein
MEDHMNTLVRDPSEAVTLSDSPKLCLALIWLKGSISADERARIQHSIMTRPGVASIEPSSKHASLLLVRFDRNSTCASGIVGWLRNSGLPAVLVGC